jgi:hypothetical protein
MSNKPRAQIGRVTRTRTPRHEIPLADRLDQQRQAREQQPTQTQPPRAYGPYGDELPETDQ